MLDTVNTSDIKLVAKSDGQLPQILSIGIQGMRCAGCVAVIEDHLKQCPDILGVSVNLLQQKAWITYQGDRGMVQDRAMSAIREAGFHPHISETAEKGEAQALPQPLVIGWIICLALAGHLHHSPPVGYITIAMLTLGWAGWQIWMDGMKTLCQGHPTMNSLVSLSMLGSCGNSLLSGHTFLSETLFLLGFILLGQWLLERTKDRARQEMTSLLHLQPQFARRVAQGQTSLIPVEALEIGDQILVLQGEAIPADGTILYGTSEVNEAMLTGESQPVLKTAGMQVWGATINLINPLTIEVQKVGADTVWAKIVHLVEQAQVSKAPIQKLADRVSAYFVWGVLSIATLTCFIWCQGMTGEQDWTMPLRMGTTVLVIACPCALGLATPTAVAMGTHVAAQQGILIKSAPVLEKISCIDTIVFDKTGTLTLGQPTVSDILPVPETTIEQLLQWAGSAESESNHPVATAIRQSALNHSLVLSLPRSTVYHPSLGIVAELSSGERIHIGKTSWIESFCIVPDHAVQRAENLWQMGKIVLFVAVDGKFQGIIALNDIPKPDAQRAIHHLHNLGIPVWLLTGDHVHTANYLGKELGIPTDRIIAEVNPIQKAEFIQKLQRSGHKVAMVGDGINDAPALVGANLSIAVGSGLDVAMESAEIILLAKQELSALTKLIHIGKTTLEKIYQNLAWAFGYNLVTVPIAAGILTPWHITLTPAIASLAMAFSSIAVVLNSLSLTKIYKSSS